MKTIQPFIDMGLYTVPLKGSLKRLRDGTKTTPIYEKNWKQKYQKEFNEEASEIGGVITGSVSNIIAIDCDNTNTYQMFKALDPDYTFHFMSKDKPKGGGTIIYKYPSTILLAFSIQNENMALDFYSDNGFVYLPTEANETKHFWDSIDVEIKPVPAIVALLLQTLHEQVKKPKSVVESPQILQNRNYLAPQLELFVKKKDFIPSLFRVITPKDFRDLTAYVKLGYLHPKHVPDGRGSEYLSKVSAILGSDVSVSLELYTKSMYLINDLWKHPIPKVRLDSTIMNPMTEKKASIDNVVIWAYDEHWEDHGVSFINKLGEAIEVFFDDIRAIYYLINYTKGVNKLFIRDTDIFSYVETVGIAPPTRNELKSLMPVVRTSTQPAKPFGFFEVDEYTRGFNLFRQTPALAILNDPSNYVDQYKRPDTILQYFDTFVPDDIQRHYLLRFIKRKLTTFAYSPVVLYFLGVPGSGKDTFISILSSILGADYIAKPTTREFLEAHNGWMVDKYFAQLDEFGDQLKKLSDKKEVLGKIKAYSGKENVQIRQMRTDGFPYKHSITFISTANTNPLMVEEDDRRLALFETPNKLSSQSWVIRAGGISNIIETIFEEINDFCYYLATEIDLLPPNDYVEPPESKGKKILIATHLSAADRLGFMLNNNMFDELNSLALDHDCIKLFSHCPDGRIFEDDLYELYDILTDGHGTKRGMNRALKQFKKVPTTHKGIKAWYYSIPTLKYYSPIMEEI